MARAKDVALADHRLASEPPVHFFLYLVLVLRFGGSLLEDCRSGIRCPSI